MATSGWEGYVHMIEHKFNKKKQVWTKTNIVKTAAIYGKDGTPWAVSENWPGLHTYEQEQDTENGTETVLVDEWKIVENVSGGVRRPGIRIGREKYGFVKYDQEFKSAQLAKSTGGAILCKTAKCIVVGIWEKEAKMSNGLN